MSELQELVRFWVDNIYEIPEDLLKKLQVLIQDLVDYKKFIDGSLPEGVIPKTHFCIVHTNGEIRVQAEIEYEVNLGLCWSCYECRRTFTDQPVAWMRRVGGHYQKRTVFTCEECVSYWYGRENHGKEKPDYLVPNRGGEVSK